VATGGVVVRVCAIVAWNSAEHSEGNGSHQLGLVVGLTACTKTRCVERA
jgi:hypothetical protein